MKSDVIAVSSLEDRTELVMVQAEKVAQFGDLSPKGTLHLRLLAEEMMSMIRAIAGDVTGEFWIENNGPKYELRLRVRTEVDSAKREKLLSVSTSGKNEANRGFMGKIRAFFEPVDDVPLYFDMDGDGVGSDMTWTMSAYQEQLLQNVRQNREGAKEAWDELEKSVIAHVADDVKISIRGSNVEMTVYKELA